MQNSMHATCINDQLPTGATALSDSIVPKMASLAKKLSEALRRFAEFSVPGNNTSAIFGSYRIVSKNGKSREET